MSSLVQCPCRPAPGQDLAPEYRQWRREHGLQPPLHGQQLAAWLLLLLSALYTAGVLLPTLCPPLRLPASVLTAALFLVHAVSHVVATVIDPADADLRAQHERRPVPEFDRARHAHVIENGRCHLCNVTIASPRTKHCAACNKCVDRFDHHCKWLNHCVGRRNYAWFLACVASAAALALLVLALAATALALAFPAGDAVSDGRNATATRPDNATANANATAAAAAGGEEDEEGDSCSSGLAMFGQPVGRPAFAATAGGFATLALVCAMLLLHLLGFHAFLAVRGTTTYEYIRQLDAEEKRAPPAAAGVDRWRWCRCDKCSRCSYKPCQCCVPAAPRKNRIRPGPAPVLPPIRGSEKQNGAGPAKSNGVASVSTLVAPPRAGGALPALAPASRHRSATSLTLALDTLQRYNETSTELPDSDSEGADPERTAADRGGGESEAGVPRNTRASVERVGGGEAADGRSRSGDGGERMGGRRDSGVSDSPALPQRIVVGSQWLKSETREVTPQSPKTENSADLSTLRTFKPDENNVSSPSSDNRLKPVASESSNVKPDTTISRLSPSTATVAPPISTSAAAPRELDLTVDNSASADDNVRGRFRITPVTQFQPGSAPAQLSSPRITRTVCNPPPRPSPDSAASLPVGGGTSPPLSPIREEPRRSKRVTFVEVAQVRSVECVSDAEDAGGQRERVQDGTRPLSAQHAVTDYIRNFRARRQGPLAAQNEVMVGAATARGADGGGAEAGQPLRLWSKDTRSLGSVKT